MELFTEESTYRGALKFLKRKSIQLAIEGFTLVNIGEFANIGVLATYYKNEQNYHIFYLYKRLRGNGYYEKVVKKHDWNIIVSDSKYYDYFKSKKINFIPFSGICKSNSYKSACEYLGTMKDVNKIPYIYRLDIRLLMLKGLGGSYSSMVAMCQDVYMGIGKNSSVGTLKIVKMYRDIRRSFYLAETHQNNEYITRPFNKEVRKMVGALKAENSIIRDLQKSNSYRSNRWMGILSVSSEFIKDQKRKLDYLKY